MAIRAQACAEVYKQALNEYAIALWPRGEDGIMFPVEWRWKLAKYACNIRCTADIAKTVRPECNLSMSALQGSTEAILEVIISSVAIIDNRTTRQVPIRETGRIANQRKRRRRDTRPISSSKEESKGDKAIDDAKITKIREQATKAAIKKVKAAKDKLQATKIAQAKKSRDRTKKSQKRADVDVSSAKTEGVNVESPEAL